MKRIGSLGSTLLGAARRTTPRNRRSYKLPSCGLWLPWRAGQLREGWRLGYVCAGAGMQSAIVQVLLIVTMDTTSAIRIEGAHPPSTSPKLLNLTLPILSPKSEAT